MPIFLSLFLVFCLWLHYEKSKSNRLHKEATTSFLMKEREANLARKKDISSLPYLSIPLETLPIHECINENIHQCIEQVTSFHQKKLINLSHLSNTELKTEYGIANFDILSEYDENYYQFTVALDAWGKALYEANALPLARQVFEYAISLPTELSNSYVYLAKIYRDLSQEEHLVQLIQTVKNSSISDSSLIAKLEQIQFKSYLL